MPAQHADAALTLYCLPYAGGNASIYRGWGEMLGPWIDCVPLDLPGHGRLRAMPALSDWPALIDALVKDIGPWPARPFAFFGHSMGALVALELAHAVRERTGREPVWLGASACVAPRERELDEARPAHWLECSTADMVAELRRLDGTPDELLADAEFLDLALPALRADFHLCASQARRARDRSVRSNRLGCPIWAFGGADDSISERNENLSAWCHETTAAFRQCMLDGGHFFVETARAQLIREIAAALKPLVVAAPLRVPHATAAAG
ncbi:thioesterase II family protein [Paraburkholderia bannensis]|uniref:thioesterase II family protein n=1 Tax=Paraburkholderia bannensis TaxID=765414 RepID=UPI002AC369EE|nr:alpha/beta fold hydrolase [Paraburkholderia bannensis]